MRGAVLVSCGLLVVGCATLSGLDGKTADLDDDGIGAPGRSDAGEDGSSSSGGPTPGGDGSSNVDGSGPLNDGSPNTPDGAPTGSRIRNITFEDKKLIDGVSGFDSTTGTPQLLSSNALVGSHSMLVEGSSAYGTVSFAPVTNLYITLRFRLDPIAQGADGAARILRVTHAGGLPIEAYVTRDSHELVVVQGNANLGKVPSLAADGTVYRLELKMLSTGDVNILVTNGVSTSAVGGDGTIGASSKVEVGSVAGGSIRATFDDIFIDSAKQP